MNREHLPVILTLVPLILLCHFSLLSNLATAEPATRVPGVKVGDTVKYGEFKALWASYVPGAVAPQDMIDVNKTSSVVNTILSVSESTISFRSDTEYLNGSHRIENKEVDVVSGNGSGNLTFVAAGLGINDKVYSIGNVSDERINATGLRGYCGLMRETSLLNTTQVFPETSIAFWVEYFWDKATGVLAEQFWSYAELTQGSLLTQGSIEYKMVDNNIWIGVSDSVPPVANAGPDQNVQAGNATILDAGASRDNVGIAKFLWQFGDGTSASSLRVAHIYNTAGVYNVTLVVEDGSGNKAFDYVTVTVQEKSYSFPTTEVLIIGLAALATLLAVWVLSKRRRPKKRRR